VEAENRIEDDLMAQKTLYGRDELNLAEFPLCALAHRLRPDQKTLQFEDRIWDERRGQTIARKLTITGSDAFGLPTALDDEVLLGLIQISKLRGFADRKVPFTRYQLIETLGWRNETKSYRRVEESLNRWTGVTLYFQNAWWNKTRRCWVDEKFHVLDNVWLCHRSDSIWESPDEERQPPRSAFVWNDVIFRSFQAGNLKGIDFDLFKELENATAKRMYRFLDKRFFHRNRWEFNLKEFAWEHTGLARSYDSAGLKRKLLSGIRELERAGYLEPMPENERFQRVCSGEWSVVFEKASSTPPTLAEDTVSSETDSLANSLIERGVTPSTARAIVRNHPADQIKGQIEVFDWLMARKDRKVSRNPPGFLASAIRSQYLPPTDFISRQEQARRKENIAQAKRQSQIQIEKRALREQDAETKRLEAISAFWSAMPPQERERREQEAMAQAPAFQKRLLETKGVLAITTKHAVLSNYALKHLNVENGDSNNRIAINCPSSNRTVK
jgi:Replication initiator protein A